MLYQLSRDRPANECLYSRSQTKHGSPTKFPSHLLGACSHRASHIQEISVLLSHTGICSPSRTKMHAAHKGASPLFYDNCLPRAERHGFYLQWTEVFVGPKTRPYRAWSSVVIDDHDSAIRQPREYELTALLRGFILIDINVRKGNDRVFQSCKCVRDEPWMEYDILVRFQFCSHPAQGCVTKRANFETIGFRPSLRHSGERVE